MSSLKRRMTSGTGYKRHSLQLVELSQRKQTALQIVLKPPAPNLPFFKAGHAYPLDGCRCSSTKSGDVEINPGPTTTRKQVWICDICHKQIHVRKQIEHTDITPPLHTMVQATHTTTTQTHVEDSPGFHRIGNVHQCIVSANQVAHQLLVNGRGTMPSNPKRPVFLPATEDYSMVYPFSEEEYRKGVAILKNNKASGRDDVLVEQLKNIGPKSRRWLLTMLNKCFMENKITTLWRQSKIIAILKPGKYSVIPKSYRPISLLCHTYKLNKRMILNRIAPTIELHLIKEQAGFRPGKSCTSQLLNLTQHIEDGYQESMITGTAFLT